MNFYFTDPKTPVWDKLLALGLGSTLLVWGGMTYWVLLFLIVALRKPKIDLPNMEADHWQTLLNATKWMAAGGLIYLITRLSLSLYHGDHDHLEPYLPFLLAPIMGLGIYKLRIQAQAYWIGIMLGSFGALLIAAYQRFGLGVERAFGHINPIPFGDISIIFAMGCVIGATQKAYVRKSFRLAMGFAALCAIFASLLSGSKGGWLSLLMVLIIGGNRTYKALHPKQKKWGAAAMLAVFIGGFALMPKSVTERISSGVQGAIVWMETGQVTEGSVSIRFELWALALRLFKEAPIAGVSHNALVEKKENWVAQGLYDPMVLEIRTIDNQYLESLARGGILGLIAMLASLVLPVIGFRRLMRCQQKTVSDLAMVGAWIPILFAEFGLSVSLWGLSAFRQFYVSWLILLIALIAVQLNSAKPTEE